MVKLNRFSYYTLNKQGPSSMVDRQTSRAESTHLFPVKCKFPDIAEEMGALYLTKKHLDKEGFEEIPLQLLDGQNSKQKKAGGGEDEKTKEVSLFSLVHPKNQDPNSIKQDRVSAVILAALVAVFALLAAFGTQNALTYTFEKLMPNVKYRWLYLYLLMFLEITLLIFFAVFCCT